MKGAKIFIRFVITGTLFAILTIGLGPAPVVSKIGLMAGGQLCPDCPERLWGQIFNLTIGIKNYKHSIIHHLILS
jgi:hypothetical protein